MHLGMPKRILVATDLTDASKMALREAAAVAEECNAELVVLYADELIPPLDAVAELPSKFLEMSEADKTAAAVKFLRKSVEDVISPSVFVDPVVVRDSPVPAILRTAKEKDADWIVMATHGRTGVERVLQGSITEEVLRHADRPVLAIHAAAA